MELNIGKHSNRVEWTLDDKLHREDGPAVEWANGDKEWLLNGELHREDGPAIEYNNGDKEWYINGELHREDGPAVEYANGDKSWYLNGKRQDGPAIKWLGEKEYWIDNIYFSSKEKFNLQMKSKPIRTKHSDRVEWTLDGKLHREDGPAREWANGEDKAWFINGKRHREDGPAVECSDGTKSWYINGKSLTEEEFNLQVKPKPIRTKYSDRVEWTLDGKYHREDGPAIEYADGTKHWYISGKLHREDGPAIERVGGDKDWFINGKRHREDGPAVEYADGTKHWYINGKSHREDGPAIEWSDGEKQWYKSDKLHREDGPAIEYANGNKYWYINGKGLTEEEFNLQMKPKPIRTEYADRVEWRLDGKLHREDGPALEFANGTKSWYINGKSLTKKEFKLRTKQKKRKEKRASMNTEDIKKVLKTSAKDVGKSIASGMKLEAIERTNDNAYDGICQLLVTQLGVDKSKLESPIMKEAILTMVPLFLHPVAVAMDGKVAYAKWAKDYAETSIELSAKRNSGAMMDSLSAMFKLLYDANQPVTSSRFTFSTDYATLAKNKLRIIAKEKNLRIITSTTRDEIIALLEQAELEDAGILERIIENDDAAKAKAKAKA